MPCFFALFALLTPRLLIVGLWFLTNWFRGMFDTVLWPILGFLFLPTSFLWYSAVQHWFGGVWGPWQIAGIVAAVLMDVGPLRRGKR